MRWDALIFDLDGTLWDTTSTCARVWNEVIARLGIRHRAVTEDDVRSVTGRPHVEAVRTVFSELSGADVLRISEATAREDNEAIAERGGTLYPGVQEHVPRLATLLPLMIVSNCQRGYIEVFLAQTAFGVHIRDYECWGNTGRTKAENLGTVIARNHLERPVFVGDTEGDQLAARANGVPFVHATYGFGAVSGAEHSIERFGDLATLIE